MNSIMLIVKHVFSLTSFFFFGYCPLSGGKGMKELILKTSFRELISMAEEIQWYSWLRHSTTSSRVVGLIPDGDVSIFH